MNDFPQIYEKSRLDEMYAQLGLPDDTIKLLQDYFSAFGKFYHIISLNDAYGIIRRHNGDLISKEDFVAFSEVVRHDDGYYYFILGADELYEDAPVSEVMDREIIHECLVDIDFELYYETVDSQSGKPLYVPEKNELLKYADNMYFEHTPQTEALYDFFHNKIGMDPDQADDMVGECVLCITCTVFPQENPVDYIISDFERMKIKFTKLQTDEFLHLICDLANNTRHCCNRGYTPCELADRLGMGEIKTIAGISTADSGKAFSPSEIGLFEITYNSTFTGSKVGRNDPCPCGSGKKYKKCCGR